MIASIVRMVSFDLRLQVRHHVLTANIVSTAFICAFIALLPGAALPVKAASFFVLADPALIGLAFVGAIVMMEKASRVHLALGVTPMPPSLYLASKAITLTAAGTASGLAVAWSARGAQFDVPLMTLALLLSNALAVLVGFVLVARSRSMNDLMIKLLYGSTVLFLPLLAYFGWAPSWSWYVVAIVPSSAMLIAFDRAMDPSGYSMGLLLAALGYLGLSVIAAWSWGIHVYQQAMISEGR